jgi:predicted phosphodiesterase
MRTLIVADVHANLEALEAVVRDAQVGGAIDAVWCLGDLVGYGPQPVECIDLLSSLPLTAVAGNHDFAAGGRIGTEDFNPIAGTAANWTADQLTEEHRAWLGGLATTLTDGEFTLVHGSLVDPVWTYLVSREAAAQHFALQTTPYCLVGHSHHPLIFAQVDGRIRGLEPLDGDALLLESVTFVANPGSVGQPRDGDPRAAYAVLDDDARNLSFHRVEYDFRRTQAKVVAAGLPSFLAERLALGR